MVDSYPIANTMIWQQRPVLEGRPVGTRLRLIVLQQIEMRSNGAI